MGRTPQSVRFIVNADDLGASEQINDAILDGMAAGVVSSSTIMATGPAFDSARGSIRRFPEVSIGVHLNVTAFTPLTGSVALQPLLDTEGRFQADLVYRVRWSRPLVNAVVEEWTAQVRRVRSAGIAVSHLDSHHHVHTLPGLFLALKRVQRRTGVRRVRGTLSVYDRAHAPTLRLRLSKWAWRQALQSVVATRTTVEFTEFLMFQRAVAEGSFAPRTWPATIELMVHPNGTPQEDGEEAAAMRSDWMKALPVRATLISYHDL